MNANYSIYWTEEAEDTFFESVAFILSKWTVKEAENFEALTFALLDKLRSNLKLCPELKKMKLRRCVVSVQTSLVYRIQGKAIELIAFVDNRSDHSY